MTQTRIRSFNFNHDQDLEVTDCPSCYVIFALPLSMMTARRADGATFYCPSGHTLSFGNCENDKVRRERDRLKQENARLADMAKAAERAEQAALEHANFRARQASAARGQVTRLKNRAAAGVCPCCNRSFEDLKRHMASKHKGFVAEPLDGNATRPEQTGSEESRADKKGLPS